MTVATPTPRPSRPLPVDRWLPPLPHPSWNPDRQVLAQPLPAAEFWKRLGL